LFSFYDIDQTRIQFVVDAENTRLEIANAIPCGLIVNELLTNSLKHAFHDGRSGRIRISLRCQHLEGFLEVADNGIGVPDGFSIEDSTTLGLKLVSVLAKQLRGDVYIDREEGVRFKIAFRLSHSQEVQPS
jgi:two-component sensor histidine kinase